jgi:aryl-alcohol dehydrogenase-like predicted oxidoreductase
MEYRRLGRTGLKVSVLGLGTGQFGVFGQSTEAECLRIADTAFDGGINLVDTADFYSFGEAEQIVAKAIKGKRDDLIVATKCGMSMSDSPNERGSSRRWIRRSVEASLTRLQTDYIDLYQIHAPDPDTDVEETLSTMSDLIREGKIRYFGFSNSTGMMVTEAALKARLRLLEGAHSEQQSYSIFVREPEAELLPACLSYGVGVMAYSPLDGGWLSGKYRKGQETQVSARQRLQPGKFDPASAHNQHKLEIVEALVSVAEEAGIDFAHMAVAFVLAHPAVACALIGGAKAKYTQQYLAGQDLRLDNEVLDRIDAIWASGRNFDPKSGPMLGGRSKYERRRQGGLPEAPAGSIDALRKAVQAESK